MEKIVTHPEHYNQGSIETLEFLTEKFGLSYVLGQVCKYCARAGKKDDTLQDIEKAIFYSTWAKEVVLAEREGRLPCKPNDLFAEKREFSVDPIYTGLEGSTVLGVPMEQVIEIVRKYKVDTEKQTGEM